MNLANGTRLGPYEIVGPIGAGGMGEVYRARDTRLGRTVAVKILPRELANDAKFKIRFEREAKAISALNHPHICTLFDVGDSYFVMEYCEGRPLASLLAGGPLPIDDVIRYGIEIAAALDAAHRRGIVHRDLKPSNVMITEGGIKLLDFGLARQSLGESSDVTTDALTGEGTLLGTVQYMAPEVLRGKPADERSDIFALGLTLYEMAAGKRAFDGMSKAEVIAAILEHEPPALAQTALDQLIRACIAKDPERRIQTASAVAAQLRSIANGAVPDVPVARLKAPAIAISALVLIAAGWYASQQRRPAAASPIRSLVVLPFENLSSAEDEYVVSGMHDGVIGELSRLGALRMISRTSAMHYSKTTKTIPEIARELNVDGIVEGSVQRSADDVRVQVRLVGTHPDERQIWSRTYERRIGAATTLPTDVARAVAFAANIPLTGEEKGALSRTSSTAPQNFEPYLRGMFEVRKQTPEAARQAIKSFEQVIAKDPNDASAHAGLAAAYAILTHGATASAEVYARAKSEAMKAIALDDTVADAHAALGAIAMYHDWDWETAGRELRRALQLNPNLAQAHRDYAWFLDLPRVDPRSIEEMKRAKELDPLTRLYRTDLSFLQFRHGHLDEAIREGREVAEMDPDWGQFPVVLALSAKGRHEEAIAVGERVAGRSAASKFVLAYAYAKAGRTSEVEKLAAEIGQTAAPSRTWQLALVYAALGDREQTLAWLEKGIDQRFAFLLWTNTNPVYAPLKGDPRFEALMRRMKLPS